MKHGRLVVDGGWMSITCEAEGACVDGGGGAGGMGATAPDL